MKKETIKINGIEYVLIPMEKYLQSEQLLIGIEGKLNKAEEVTVCNQH